MSLDLGLQLVQFGLIIFQPTDVVFIYTAQVRLNELKSKIADKEIENERLHDALTKRIQSHDEVSKALSEAKESQEGMNHNQHMEIESFKKQILSNNREISQLKENLSAFDMELSHHHSQGKTPVHLWIPQ